MATELVYLKDTYQFTHTAKVESLSQDDRGQYCVLDQTIFYPQGGGQPSDTGFLGIQSAQVPISFAAFVEGEVRHYGDFSGNPINLGTEVVLSIDRDRRITHAKAHTAGHLLADVVESLGKGLIAVKGHHFPDGSYVEFQGNVPTEEAATFIEEVNDRLSKILSSDEKIQTYRVSLEDLKTLGSRTPTNLPTDKPMRVVKIGSFQVTPCGGTHLKSLGELQEVVITKAKRRKGHTKVSYTFA